MSFHPFTGLKTMVRYITLIATLVLPAYCDANVIINGTRVIYPASSKFVNIQLVNKSSSTHLVQSWIDDGDPVASPESIHVPFVLTPPVVKMGAGEGQELKITFKAGQTVAADQETVYWLNTLDIPPVPESADGAGNYLQVAIRSRIKLLYRPTSIPSPVIELHKKLSVKQQNGTVCLNNDSPYYVTVPQIIPWNGGDLRRKTDNNILDKTLFIKPFSCQRVSSGIKPGKYYRITWIDDYGAKKLGIVK